MSSYIDCDTHYIMIQSRGIWAYKCKNPETGKWCSRSCGTRNLNKALIVISKRLAEGKLLYPDGYRSRGASPKPKYDRRTFGELTENYFVHGKCPIEAGREKRGKKICLSTLYTYEKNKKAKILPYWKDEIPRNITEQMCDRYLLSLPDLYGITRSSANTVFGVFRTMLDQLKKDGFIDSNPAAGVKPLANDTKEKDVLTVEELHRLFDVEWPSKIAKTAMKTAAQTGMRLGEVRALKGEQIQGLSIVVDASFSRIAGRKEPKNYKTREVPITQSLKDELMQYARGDDEYLFSIKGSKPISVNAILKNLKTALKRAGIGKHITPHCLRHGFNTMLISHNVSSTIVKSAIGHSSDAMTEHYLHLKADDMDAIRAVQEEIGN